MKLRCWICTLFAMMLAATMLFSSPAMAQTSSTLVREVTLSPGNWLWNHYARMSAEYKSAHPYQQFLESDACFLKDRKCTEEDWQRVPKTQKVYIPAEPIFVHVPPSEPVPGITLEENPNDIDLFAVIVDEKAISATDAGALAADLAIQKAANSALESEYSLLVTFLTSAVSLLIVLAIALVLYVVFLLSRLSKTKQALENAESLFSGYPKPSPSPEPTPQLP